MFFWGDFLRFTSFAIVAPRSSDECHPLALPSPTKFIITFLPPEKAKQKKKEKEHGKDYVHKRAL